MRAPSLSGWSGRFKVDELSKIALDLSVRLDVDMRGPECWYLNEIERTQKNRGAGAAVLGVLHSLADEHCARIRLVRATHGSLVTPILFGITSGLAMSCGVKTT